MNLFQAVPAKRAAKTCQILVVDVEMQTTPPVPSLPQPGAETVVPARVLNGLQTVPLKMLEVYPPAVLRPTHRTFPTAQMTSPAPSAAQLGLEVTVPVIVFQTAQAVPFH